MNRFLVCALVASIGNASAAFAGESLLTSGTRHVQQIAIEQSATAASTAPASSASPAVVAGQKTAPSFQAEGGGNLSKSSHSKATKTLIYAALAVGFAVSAWEIDRHVLNITPSSLGQRKD
jgi:hypothetical protein